MKAKKFEQQFDEGVDLTVALDVSKAKLVLQEQRRVNVDFPTWMIDTLDREASEPGVTRQSVIKVWLAERLKASVSSSPLQRTRAGGGNAELRVKPFRQVVCSSLSGMTQRLPAI